MKRTALMVSMVIGVVVAATLALHGAETHASGLAKAVPEYRLVEDWIDAPEEVAGVSGVTVDEADNVYAFRRDANNVWILDADGRLVKEWGQDIAMWTHGIRLDDEGNIWTSDGQGHQVKKWSPDASELLMTLGEYNVSGEGPNHFNRPTDVAFAPNGDFFIFDGYVNSRVAKYSRSGRFIKSWGGPGDGPSQFNTVHSIIVDQRDRVLVADRDNARIQIFDLDGNYQEEWTHLGSPYALFITADDILYVADGVNAKVWIADAATGHPLGTIENTDGIHWVAVNSKGEVYAGSNRSHYLRKYAPVGSD